ncbi:MAG: YggT family protein [Solirubrobacteraceae bacterium]|jgi:YggT family protein
MIVAQSSLRLHAAQYVSALAWVYTIAIIAYVVTSLFLSLGLRIPYYRWSDAVLTFLRDVTEPFLRLFRRILPPLGGLDLSPIVAIVLVQLAGTLASHAISG